MIGTAALGYGTLPVHQEAVPPPLLGQSVLVALSDVGIQLALLIADGLYILGRGRKKVGMKKHGMMPQLLPYPEH